jgi:hypothetical protein
MLRMTRRHRRAMSDAPNPLVGYRLGTVNHVKIIEVLLGLSLSKLTAWGLPTEITQKKTLAP